MIWRADSPIAHDNAFGLLDRQIVSPGTHNPLLISNEGENTMLRAILGELHRSHHFVFSIAFITTDALAMLKQALLDFRGTGMIVTSNYLEFNAPAMFRELHDLEGVEVYVYPGDKGGFHAKGYVFEQAESTTAIVGSSNLTSSALLRNREWNLRLSSMPDGDLTRQLAVVIDRQIEESQLLTKEWIEAYEERYVASQVARPVVVASDAVAGFVAGDVEIVPNGMQREALEQIAAVRDSGERRAVVISATGTGKTVLAALDVREANPARVLFIAHRE